MRLKRKPEKRDWLNIAVITALLLLFVRVGFEYTRLFGEVRGGGLAASAENLRRIILSYDGAGILVTLLLHVLHVVVSVIPAALIQFAGGLIYGIPIGMAIGIIGVSIGTALSFYLSRLLGRRVMTLFISEKNINRLERLVSGNTSAIVLLLLFMLPTPKDFFAYFFGLTNMKASKFFLISAVGRLPGMLVATYLGAGVLGQSYAPVIVVSVLSCAAIVSFYLFKDKIIGLISGKE